MSLRRRLRGRGLTSRADESKANLGGGLVVAIAFFLSSRAGVGVV